MESRDLVVDQVLVEYQAYCTGQLSERLGTTEAPDGAVEYCGDQDDPAHWAICYVRASDGVVRPLVVGQQVRVLDEFRAMDRRGVPFWDPLLFPPPVAVIGGHEYPFKAAGGRHLLGVVRLEGQAVLLAAADDRLVAVLLVDGSATAFPLGRPRALREVDVDLLRAFSRPTHAAASKSPDEPLRPSPRTRAQHIRIVPGRKVELGDGPTVAEVLAAAFEDIGARATTPRTRPRRRKKSAAAGKAASPAAATKRLKLIGKKAVPIVLEYLRRIALRGCHDLVGFTGDIIREIQVRCRDFKMTGEAFADALKLIAATGTCLIGPRDSGDRIWEIKLAGLNDPTSAHHLRLCLETRSRVRLEEAAANQRAAAGDRVVPAGPHASPVAAKSDGPLSSGQAGNASTATAPDDVADTTHRNESTSPGGRQSTHPDPSEHAQDLGASVGPAPSTTTASAHSPTAETVTTTHAETLDLVTQLGMNPIGGFMFLLWCIIQTMGPRAVVASDDATGVESADPCAEAEPTPTAASDGAVHIEAPSRGDDAATTVEGRDGPSTTHGDKLEVLVGPWVVLLPAAPGRVTRILTPYRALWRWTRPSQRYVARRASLRVPPPLHRHDAFAPVKPAPGCRDLGTRGPRGPPHAERLTQPTDARSAAECRGRR